MDLTSIIVVPDTNLKSMGLLGSATLVFDGLLTVREVKIIRDKSQLCFLEFPGYPRRRGCPVCKRDNGLAANFCCRCGQKLEPIGTYDQTDSVTHPNNADFRAWITDKVLDEYVKERDGNDARR